MFKTIILREIVCYGYAKRKYLPDCLFDFKQNPSNDLYELKTGINLMSNPEKMERVRNLTINYPTYIIINNDTISSDHFFHVIKIKFFVILSSNLKIEFAYFRTNTFP